MTNSKIRERLEVAAEDSRRLLIQYKPRFQHEIRDERIRRVGVKMFKEWLALIHRLTLPDIAERINPTKRRRPKLTKREAVIAAADFVASTAAPRISARQLLAEHARSQASDFDVLDRTMAPPNTKAAPPPTELAGQDSTDSASSTADDEPTKKGDQE